MNRIIAKMVQLDIKDLQIEKNMGHGADTNLFKAQLDKLRLWCSIGSTGESFLAFLAMVQLTPQALSISSQASV